MFSDSCLVWRMSISVSKTDRPAGTCTGTLGRRRCLCTLKLCGAAARRVQLQGQFMLRNITVISKYNNINF